jgi:hypothetical protein
MTQEEERDYPRPLSGRDVLASWIVGIAVLCVVGILLAM